MPSPSPGGAADRRDQGSPRGDDVDVRAVAKDEEWKSIEFGIEAGHAAAEPGAGADADRDADRAIANTSFR